MTTEGGYWYSVNTDNWEIEEIIIKDNNNRVIQDKSCGMNLIFDGTFLWGVTCAENAEGRIHRYNTLTQEWKMWQLPSVHLLARMILPKTENQFWVFTRNRSTGDGNIFLFDTDQNLFTSYEQLTGETAKFENRTVYHAIQSKTQIIWLATTNGLVKFDPNALTTESFYINYNDSGSEIISTIHEKEDGNLLIGTYEQGLFNFNVEQGKFSPFTLNTSGENTIFSKKDMLPNNNIAGIIPVEKNNFLVSTFNGLAYLDMEEKVVAHFFKSNGLSNNEYNRLAYFKDNNDHIFVGGINGFDVFKLEDLKKDKTLQPPIVTRFYKFDRREGEEISQYNHLDFIDPVIIEPSHLFFGVEFMLPNYLEPEYNQFQTWLEGWENDYGVPTRHPRVQFNRLPAGAYRLHIKAKDGQGNSSSQPLIIPIIVQPVFYLTWWFIPLCILLAGGGIFIFVQNRVRSAREKRQAEKERQAIQRQFVELELKTLRMQLNPHFIFNSLGAIQHYIEGNHKRLAINYLADFARLMRLFLESSKKRFITLDKELELIQLYVSLEQMRFDNKFEVTYELEEGMDTHMIELPSLLLQPFIENAINHGLRNKKELGHLTIKFQLCNKEETLWCIIEDDGIGRARDAALKQASILQHKSRGTEIIQERLAILKASGEINLDIKVEDLDPTQLDCGTRVVVSIPNMD